MPEVTIASSPSQEAPIEQQPRPATVRDVLLWAAVFVPFSMLPYLRARSHLMKLRREIDGLVNRSSKQHDAVINALLQVRQHHDEASAGLRRRFDTLGSRITSDSSAFEKLIQTHDQASATLSQRLDAITEKISDSRRERLSWDERQLATGRATLAGLDDIRARMALSARTTDVVSRKVGTSLADVAAFMEEIETQHGMPRVGPDPRGIERLRRVAMDLERAHQSDLIDDKAQVRDAEGPSKKHTSPEWADGVREDVGGGGKEDQAS